jgi:large subunit ribosomal protein L17
MLNNLATSILRQGLNAEPLGRKVITTVPKAKVVRGLVDRLITYAKKGDLAARRQAAKFVHDSEVLQGLFSDLGPRYAKRAGGYTRILKVAENRKGDNAEMALITLVEEEISPPTSPAKRSGGALCRCRRTRSARPRRPSSWMEGSRGGGWSSCTTRTMTRGSKRWTRRQARPCGASRGQGSNRVGRRLRSGSARACKSCSFTVIGG